MILLVCCLLCAASIVRAHKYTGHSTCISRHTSCFCPTQGLQSCRKLRNDARAHHSTLPDSGLKELILYDGLYLETGSGAWILMFRSELFFLHTGFQLFVIQERRLLGANIAIVMCTTVYCVYYAHTLY